MKKIIDLRNKGEEEKGEESFLNWRMSEKGEREKNWQIGLIIFLIICLIFVLWQKNYFGLILVLVISFLLFSSPSKKEIYFALLKRGARRGNEIFPWHNLQSFWIFESPPEIYFQSKKAYLPYHIIFPLPRDYIDKTRKILSDFIPEKETEKNFFDILSERLGL